MRFYLSYILKKVKKVNIVYYFFYYNSEILIYLVVYIQFKKTWAKILSQRQDCIAAILKKHDFK